MRAMIAVFVFAATMGFGVVSGHAFGDAQWCEVKNLGSDVVWNCQYRTAEECAPHVIAGDRSFCNINPYWHGATTPAAAPSQKRSKPQG